jgi:hypothetical protein
MGDFAPCRISVFVEVKGGTHTKYLTSGATGTRALLKCGTCKCPGAQKNGDGHLKINVASPQTKFLGFLFYF